MPATPPPPTPLGQGSRLAQLVPPLNGDMTDNIPPNPSHPAQNANVDVTGVAVSTVDRFDETKDGKSLGYVYVQDVGSQAPFSGIEMYQPSYNPADLHVAPGDIVDANGPYQDYGGPSGIFGAMQVIPELGKPIVTFRFEYKVPEPVVVDPNDLQVMDYDHYVKGLQWMSMLVTVKNVALTVPIIDEGCPTGPGPGVVCSGRVYGHITNDKSGIGLTISNELFDLQPGAFPTGTTFASVTGIVTYFVSFHIAPRSLDDLVVAQ